MTTTPGLPGPHVPQEIPALLTGELNRPEALRTVAHLRGCDACTQDLLASVLASCALQAAFREETGAGSPSSEDRSVHTVPRSRSAAARRHRLARRAVPVALSLALVVGAVAFGAEVLGPGGGPSRTGRVIAEAALRRLTAPPQASGTVVVTSSGSLRQLTVRTHNLRSPGANRFYEVWLLDPATNKMLPMGVLPPTGVGSYGTTASIMAGYSAVDISVQYNDGDPAHSKVSELRATL